MITHKHPTSGRLQFAYTAIVIIVLICSYFILESLNATLFQNENKEREIGTAIDSLNGVPVYFNGNTGHVDGKNIAPDGYMIGLKWQCVEFVKRYYYMHFHHVMPDATGDAKDFFDTRLPDASYNEARALVQYRNPSLKKPALDDIIVFEGHPGNKYGHIAIISKVYADKIEIVQQNAGPDEPSRALLNLRFKNGRWEVMQRHVLGWLRIE